MISSHAPEEASMEIAGKSRIARLHDLGQVTAIDFIDYPFVVGDPAAVLGKASPAEFCERLEERIVKQTVPEAELDTLIARDRLGKLTSNPSILEKAITDPANTLFRSVIQSLREKGLDAAAVLTRLQTTLIRLAAVKFETVHRETGGEYGNVSIETDPLDESPQGAADSSIVERYLEQIRAFHALSPSGNIDVKVAMTSAGVAACRAATAEGIKINSTTLFPDIQVIDNALTLDAPQYLASAEAYIGGLEDFTSRWLSDKGVQRLDDLLTQDLTALRERLALVVSVDSQFVSRVGVLAHTQMLDAEANRAYLEQFRMPLEVAQLKLMVEMYRVIYEPGYVSSFRFTPKVEALSSRFAALRDLGARPKRLFFASTGVKAPQEDFLKRIYGDAWDLTYVQELIAPGTLATHPPETYHAFNARGIVDEPTIQKGLDRALAVLHHTYQMDAGLINRMNRKLLEDGFRQFHQAYHRTLDFIRSV